MKRTLFLIALMIIMITSLFAERISLGSDGNSLQVLQSTTQETILQYQIQHFDTQEVQIRGSSWHHITLPKEGITQDKGLPALPVFNRSITIDGMGKMKLEIFDIEYTDLKLPIAPSKGVIYRNIDPATVPYEFDPIYQGNSFYPEQIASLSEPYILRDFRGITIKTIPFAYRPSTGTLRVYTAYKVRVYRDGRDTLNTMSQSRDSISRDFAPLYENHFVNWQNQRYVPVNDSYGKLLVICHTSFMTAIQPWVNWKKQKGIETELVQWSTIGTTAAQLQSYIQNRYNQDSSLTYVQLVGDGPQIPSLNLSGGGSDPSFSLVAGNDNYPDIFIGRFSAETVNQLNVQLNRSIAYERNTTTSDTWLSKAMGIASSEGGSGGDNNETDIQHMNVIRTKLLNYGYSSVDQVYDPGASATTVSANVNAGRGFMNYVGHGSDTTWGTTGFSYTNAMNLSNGNKAPFIVDVACVNGNFVSQTCFAEGWMRSPSGGAITIYASTINQSWASPMRGQDEITDLWVAETKNTAGGFYFNGSCKMMDTYGNTTGSDGVNMFKTWHIFGDASLMARSKTPVAMTVTHPNQILIGASNMTVNTGVANALVALSYNNQLYARGFTNSSGTLTLPLSGMPAGSINYTLTVTAHNRVTYIGNVQQIPGSGPYVTVESTQYADGNNQAPDYGDSATFNVRFKNVGAAAATNLNATLSSTTPGIIITDASEALGNLAAGASITRNSAFAFTIANNIANGAMADFTITMVSGSESWTHEFPITLNAPALSFGAPSIADPSGNNNGMLDPGETVSLTIPILNGGGAASPAGSASLSCSTTASLSQVVLPAFPQSLPVAAET
ncbi:MAG: C25 family cysteine peptidase [Candidatus Cloacimonetes bacterium]|nr:C25 family cysteine peptidase [Candidatus Cloacimonadota bacterium]MDY0172866.1 C25 family cysteine peptidase [Candidatus Cloacimonadaceae bacterium]